MTEQQYALSRRMYTHALELLYRDFEISHDDVVDKLSKLHEISPNHPYSKKKLESLLALDVETHLSLLRKIEDCDQTDSAAQLDLLIGIAVIFDLQLVANPAEAYIRYVPYS